MYQAIDGGEVRNGVGGLGRVMDAAAVHGRVVQNHEEREQGAAADAAGGEPPYAPVVVDRLFIEISYHPDTLAL